MHAGVISAWLFCCIAFGCAQTSALYLCQPTSNPSSGQVYTPNIPGSYFNFASLSTNTATRNGFTYFFTIPPRDCNGSVAAIEFCYRAELTNRQISSGQSLNVFELLMVSRQGLLFTFTSRSIIQVTPSSSSCVATGPNVGPRTPHDCCTSVIPPNEFQIPSLSYTFGVRLMNTANARPIAFGSSVQQFSTWQFQAASSTTAGNQVTLTGPVFDGILLLRFIIGELYSVTYSYPMISMK
jgi:hypothetical protein